MKKYLFITTVICCGLYANNGFAQCTETTDCTALGYTETSCLDGGIKCPFGDKWACHKSDCNGFANIPDKTQCPAGYRTSITASGKNCYTCRENLCETCKIGNYFNSDFECTVTRNYNSVGVVYYTSGSPSKPSCQISFIELDCRKTLYFSHSCPSPVTAPNGVNARTSSWGLFSAASYSTYNLFSSAITSKRTCSADLSSWGTSFWTTTTTEPDNYGWIRFCTISKPSGLNCQYTSQDLNDSRYMHYAQCGSSVQVD